MINLQHIWTHTEPNKEKKLYPEEAARISWYVSVEAMVTPLGFDFGQGPGT